MMHHSMLRLVWMMTIAVGVGRGPRSVNGHFRTASALRSIINSLMRALRDRCCVGSFRRFPLAAGYQGALTVFSIWKNAEDTSAFAVSGSESLELGGKRYDAWVPQSPSGARTWVDKTSNRVLQVFTPDNDRGFWLVLRVRA